MKIIKIYNNDCSRIWYYFRYGNDKYNLHSIDPDGVICCSFQNNLNEMYKKLDNTDWKYEECSQLENVLNGLDMKIAEYIKELK